MASNLVVASSIPGKGSRTFSDLPLTSDLGGYVKARSATPAENMDLVVIRDGDHAAKKGGLLRRESRKGTIHRLLQLVVTLRLL
jgi:hypothetical protein